MIQEPYEEDDPWLELGIPCGGYCSDIDDAVIAVLHCLRDDEGCRWFENCAKATGLNEMFVRLLFAALSKAWFTYGTSPRGIFPDCDLDALIARWEAYYLAHWETPYTPTASGAQKA